MKWSEVKYILERRSGLRAPFIKAGVASLFGIRNYLVNGTGVLWTESSLRLG